MSSGVGELFTDQVSHLSSSHRNFFIKWYGLVALEEAESRAKNGLPLWLSDPIKRYWSGLAQEFDKALRHVMCYVTVQRKRGSLSCQPDSQASRYVGPTEQADADLYSNTLLTT